MVTEAYAHVLTARRRFSDVVGPVFGLLLVAIVLLWLAVNLVKDPYSFFRVMSIGITNGSLYALVALGYTLVYGILQLINFAHGDVFMLGGMFAATVILDMFALGEDPSLGSLVAAILVALAVAMLACGLINATVEAVAYRPLRRAPRLAPLITAIGMSFVLQDVGLVWKGSETVAMPRTLPDGAMFTIGTCPECVRYTWDRLVVLVITVPVLLLLIWLVQYTRQGKAMRATAQDKEAAAMMGINVNRTISVTFMLAGALAAAGGLLFLLEFNMRYDTGFELGLIAFTAAVVGGIGNLSGAVLGALLIGFIQAFNEGLTWMTPGSDWTRSIVFGILIAVLVFRPEGLLGERTPEGA